MADDLVEVGPITGIEFRMEQFVIGANFESAAARRNERERFDSFAEFKNLGRQTDGLGRVVSDDAIFDRDFRLHSGVLLSGKNGTELGKGGQGAREFSRRERGDWLDEERSQRPSTTALLTHFQVRCVAL